MDYEIRIFSSANNLSLCNKYAAYHKKMLKNFQVGIIESMSDDWMYQDRNYVMLVQDKHTAEPFGGGRIQVKSVDGYLPVERALKDYSGNIVSQLNIGNGVVAELCGVWFNKRAVACGLKSIVLIRFAIAIAQQLNIDAMLGFCSPYTLPLITKTGGRVVSTLGDNGCFPYPTSNVISTLLVYEDLINLPFATHEERFRIQSLRQNGYCPSILVGYGGVRRLHYEICPDIVKQTEYCG